MSMPIPWLSCKRSTRTWQLTADDAFLTSLPGGANAIAQLQPFVVQGLLAHDANKFHTVIAFHQGQATFNGKPYGMNGPPAN